MAPVLRRACSRARPSSHWCFDLYPEAITAEGIGAGATLEKVGPRSDADRLRRATTRSSTSARACASAWLNTARPRRQETLVPWALAETDHADRRSTRRPGARCSREREARAALLGHDGPRPRIFGLAAPGARLSGAERATRSRFCFSVRGNRADELARKITPDDSNVSLAPFADEATLHARLAAADLHLVSLRADWAGVVVPSKFFASLAVGRPVLYAGPADSEIARWIARARHRLSRHRRRRRTPSPIGCTSAARRRRRARAPARNGALAVYRREWSKAVTNDRWDRLLRDLLQARA